MQITFEISKAHVCQDNVCFKTSYVLVKNMTDKVILGKGFMMNAVQEIRNRPVLAKNNRIIIFGEDMSVLGIWGKRLKVSNYRYINGQWWSKTDKDPKDLIDHNQFSGSDGTWHLDYCTTCEEWGHNDCDFIDDGAWGGSLTHYDPYDDEYVDDD
jgi:hypothetical protein